MPLLKDPNAAWDGLAVCTHGKGNHAVVDRQWRYIRYADGTEELYDHSKDPYEWTNLAAEVGMSDIKAKLGAVIPKEEVPSTFGSKGGKDSDKKAKGKKKAKGSADEPPRNDVEGKSTRHRRRASECHFCVSRC